MTMNDKLRLTSTRGISPLINKPPLVETPLEEWDEEYTPQTSAGEHLSRDSEDSRRNAAAVCERDLQLKTAFFSRSE